MEAAAAPAATCLRRAQEQEHFCKAARLATMGYHAALDGSTCLSVSCLRAWPELKQAFWPVESSAGTAATLFLFKNHTHLVQACQHVLTKHTCAAPSFQFVLLGVCLGEGLTGVEILKASFQSRRGNGLAMLMSVKGPVGFGVSCPELIVARARFSRNTCQVAFKDLRACFVTRCNAI